MRGGARARNALHVYPNSLAQNGPALGKNRRFVLEMKTLVQNGSAVLTTVYSATRRQQQALCSSRHGRTACGGSGAVCGTNRDWRGRRRSVKVICGQSDLGDRLARQLDCVAATRRRNAMVHWSPLGVLRNVAAGVFVVGSLAGGLAGCIDGGWSLVCDEYGCRACYRHDDDECYGRCGAGMVRGPDGRCIRPPDAGGYDGGADSGNGGDSGYLDGGSGDARVPDSCSQEDVGGDTQQPDGDTPDVKPDARSLPDCKAGTMACVCGPAGECEEGLSCLDGICLSPCQYTSQCDGKVCVDGRCTAPCGGANSCDDGYVCGVHGVCVADANGSQCGAGDVCEAPKECVNGWCRRVCMTHDQCRANELCDGSTGLCIDDPQPHRPCAADASVCGAKVCVDGFCRYRCETNNQCKLIDVRIPVCKNGICVSLAEVAPQCLTKQDCPSGKSCISNTCK